VTEGRRESWRYKLAMYTLLALGGIPILLPIYWLALGSLKTKERVEATPPDWLPVVPRDYLLLDGQELPVTIFDDGRAAGTGVCRIKLRQDEGATIALAAGSIRRDVSDQYFARVAGIRRRVVPVGSAASAPGERVHVELLGTLRQVQVPDDAIEVAVDVRVLWAVFGRELRVTCDEEPLPESGEVTIQWEEPSPAIRIDPALFTADRARVWWRERELPAELVRPVAPGGYCTIRLVYPEGGLRVPVSALRREERVRRFAVIQGERHEVKVLRRDARANSALVELLGEPERAWVARSALDHVTHAEYRAPLLGEEQVVEPVTEPLPAAADARVAVRVPGQLAVTRDHIRSEAPLRPQWRNFAAAWREQTFDLYVVNTVFIAALVVLGSVLSCGLVGYAFARLEFRGRDGLFLLLLGTLMVPLQVTSIPTFVMFAKFGWIDSYKPLIVPHLLAQSAFFVFLFRQFMLTIPTDLEDSARIDGCGPLATWWLLMMPLSRPIVVTVAVFAFLYAWNDFLYPLLYINSDEKQTVALGLQNFKSAFQYSDQHLLMAATVMMIVPSVVLFFVAQRAFVRGVVVSGVKG